MLRPPRLVPPTANEWADLGEAILLRWFAVFEPPLWSHQLVPMDSLAMSMEQFDAGRTLAGRGVRMTLGEATSNALDVATAVLAQRVEEKLLMEAVLKRRARKSFLRSLAVDVSYAVFAEVALRQVDIVEPWIPGFSRVLDAWGAGLALGRGIDEDGVWPVASLGVEREIQNGPVRFSSRQRAVEELLARADGWVRATIVSAGEMSAVDFDFELNGKRMMAEVRRSRRSAN